jgi:D-alanyl-lipoteichoic acid acyltransferase DltB (MBOAT superfamily)
MHGLAIVVHRFWQNFSITMPAVLSWFLTFLFVVLAWVMFRAESVSAAISIYRGMLGMNGFVTAGFSFPAFNHWVSWLAANCELLQAGLFIQSLQSWIYIAVFLALALFVPNTLQLSQYSGFCRWNVVRHNFTYVLCLTFVITACLLKLLSDQPSEFLYFNF